MHKYALLLNLDTWNLKFVSLDKNNSIKNDYKNFSENEKKFFINFKNEIKLKDFSAEDIDIYKIKKTSFQFLIKKDNKILKIDEFVQEKIKIIFEQKKENSGIYNIDDFVFKAELKFDFGFWLDKNYFFVSKNKINKISFDSELELKIFRRLINKKYDRKKYSSKYETKLLGTEILEINFLLELFSKQFILKNLEKFSKYNISKIEDKKIVLKIDYSFSKEELKIYPVIKYGIIEKKINEIVKTHKDENGKEDIFLIDQKNKILIKVKEDTIFWVERDLGFELKEVKKILVERKKMGFNKKMLISKKGKKQIDVFIKKYFKNFAVYEKEYVHDNFVFDFKKVNLVFEILDTEEKILLKSKLKLSGQELSLVDLKKLVKDGEIYRSGKIIKVENNQDLKKILNILKHFNISENEQKIELEKYQIFELEALKKEKILEIEKEGEKYNDMLQQLSRLNSVKNYDNFKIPDNFSKILRSYQKEGLYWMDFLRKNNFGGILADDMGLGKTIQVLAYFSILKNNNELKKNSLILMPKSLLENWKIELKKFAPNLNYILIDGDLHERENKIDQINQGEFDIILTSYTLFQRDFEFYQKNNIDFNYVILDEAQYIKNFNAKISLLVKEIKSKYRLALSGTPLENSLLELWSIFDFLMPNFLGSYKYFRENYLVKILNNDKDSLRKLKILISNFILRREKKDVLKELPDKIEQNIYLDLSNQQKIIYSEILDEIKKEFQKIGEREFKNNYFNLLSNLMKLRQVVNHPNLIFKEDNYEKYQSSKVEVFLNLLDEIVNEGRKVLVFSQFTSMLNILESEIKKKKYQYLRLDGSTKERMNLVNEFNENDNKKIFLISLKAGGLGLNLTSADNVIIFDPWWNPFAESQAIDRSHRMGQKKTVNVYKLIAKNTIEDKILKLQKNKKRSFDILLGDSLKNSRKINFNDFKELFDL